MLDALKLAEVLIPFVRGVTGGEGAGSVQTLVGDASTRRYHRVRVPGGAPDVAVVMELPDEPLKSDEASGPALPPELPSSTSSATWPLAGWPFRGSCAST